MTEKTSDQELISQSLNGDMDSFRILVERYEGQIAGVVKSMLGDSPEAMDVGQEVFVRFYQNMHKFKGEAALSTYLTRIGINLSLNELKRRKRRADLFRPLESAENVGDSEASWSDDLQLLKHGMDQLDGDSKSVITLRILEGYSTEETADILKVPTGTVLSRLFRAQQKLKQILSKTTKV